MDRRTFVIGTSAAVVALPPELSGRGNDSGWITVAELGADGRWKSVPGGRLIADIDQYVALVRDAEKALNG